MEYDRLWTMPVDGIKKSDQLSKFEQIMCYLKGEKVLSGILIAKVIPTLCRCVASRDVRRAMLMCRIGIHLCH